MNRENLLNIYKVLVTFAGFIVLILLSMQITGEIFSFGFIIFSILSITIASRLHLQLPRTDFYLNFSDSVIFISFLVFGGREAVIISALEMISACYLLKRKGVVFSKFIIPYNIASSILTTAISYKILVFTGISSNYNASTANLVTTLGILVISQFTCNSIFTSILISLKENVSLKNAWKKSGFSLSVTQIAGASVAGVVYKIIYNGDYFATSIAIAVLFFAYLNYRKVIDDMTKSINEAEKAQKEKAESERMKAEQAEQHAKELGIALAEQEIISEKLQESNHALEHSAYYDSLTDLPNRTYLIERLRLLFQLKINITNNYYVLFLDLKRFKNINNRLGHAVGDKVLVMISKRLLRLVKMEDTIARLGGDEFAIILNDLKSPEEAIKYARRICQKLSQPFSLQGHKIFVRVNVGISPLEPEHKKPEDILRDADIAMHHAKEKEIDYALFDTELRSRVLETIKLESNLRFAMDKQELSMYYQPLISLDDGEIIGFEALLRWHHPVMGLVPPAKFIPIAEDSGLIIPITEWILEQTTRQIVKWQQISPNYKNLMVSVNISGKHISQDGLVATIQNALKISRLKPTNLKLEITESTAMEDAERTVKVLTQLKELGTQLSIDDFGTGYSSLSYLHRLPFDTLKIDRSFVYSVGEQGENSEILQTIISLAKNLKMRVIAEGIETESQLRLLRNLGCDYGQGYLMSKPLPKDEMEPLLYQKHLWFPKSFVEKEFGTNETDSTHGEIIYTSKVSQ